MAAHVRGEDGVNDPFAHRFERLCRQILYTKTCTVSQLEIIYLKKCTDYTGSVGTLKNALYF